jgi:hypothetical protein
MVLNKSPLNIPEVNNQYLELLGPSSLLFTQIVGSRLFRHHSETSDYDLRVITFPDKDYFRPNLSGTIIGFDQINLPLGDQYSVINDKKQFTVKEEGGFERKYDIFKYDCLLYFRMMTQNGAYYYLSNSHAEENFYIESHPTFLKFRKELIENIPDFSYLLAAKVLLRDFESLMTVSIKSSKMPDSLKVKRLGQYTFIKNFLLLRNLYGHGVDYVYLKNRKLSVDEILEEIQKIKKDLYKFIDEKTQIYLPKAQNDIVKFKETLYKMFNSIYDEEIFPIP